nr:transcription termination factor Rho [Helcococcus sueciensis]
MNIDNLSDLKLNELKEIAKDLGIKSISKYNKENLIELIKITHSEKSKQNQSSENIKEKSQETSKESPKMNQNKNHENNDTEEIEGLLEVLPDGFGFIRTEDFDSGESDVFVSPTQIRRFRLKTGDNIKGLIRPANDEKEKYPPLIYVLGINNHSPENAYKRRDFEDLKPIYPTQKLNLIDDENNITNRMIDLFSPIGKGQRGLIVAPPKTGKTTIIKSIANAIEKNHPEVKIFILLIDERPEEVTDIERSVNKYTDNRDKFLRTEIVASTFDEQLENHARSSEMTLERAKRLVEEGKDVVILLDSITRMARAYNILTPSSGKTLSGGLDPLALYKPKRFFGAARNIEGGGSLTILATALVDTGSRMDDMIFEEFKGTGNMELNLDRDLQELRIFPAIDIIKSGTRRDDLLLSKQAREAVMKISRMNKNIRIDQGMMQLIKIMNNSKNNEEFIKVIKNI